MNNIKKYRESMGMSQAQLGNHLGVSRACISQWENTNTLPRMTSLQKMASLFGCEVSDLFSTEENVDKRDATIRDYMDAELLRSFHELTETQREAVLFFIRTFSDK